jgi:hypothetical protein
MTCEEFRNVPAVMFKCGGDISNALAGAFASHYLNCPACHAFADQQVAEHLQTTDPVTLLRINLEAAELARRVINDPEAMPRKTS